MGGWGNGRGCGAKGGVIGKWGGGMGKWGGLIWGLYGNKGWSGGGVTWQWGGIAKGEWGAEGGGHRKVGTGGANLRVSPPHPPW